MLGGANVRWVGAGHGRPGGARLFDLGMLLSSFEAGQLTARRQMRGYLLIGGFLSLTDHANPFSRLHLQDRACP